MEVRFCRGRGGRYSITWAPANGEETWYKPDGYFVHHDLIHYAVETTLGYRDAFHGLMARGWDMKDFGEKDRATGKTRPLPPEAHHAEAIVGLLQLEQTGSVPPEEFFPALEATYAAQGEPPPALTPAQVDRIRERIRALFAAWAQLPEGESLTLPF